MRREVRRVPAIADGFREAYEEETKFETIEVAALTPPAVAAPAAKAVADHFKSAERERGGFTTRFINPITKQTEDNGVTIPVKLLRALVAEVERAS